MGRNDNIVSIGLQVTLAAGRGDVEGWNVAFAELDSSIEVTSADVIGYLAIEFVRVLKGNPDWEANLVELIAGLEVFRDLDDAAGEGDEDLESKREPG